MSNTISRAESFDKVAQIFQNINFSAFDYYTVKQSLIDYVKTTFPENFNDFIESSEFIAILELFAYISEQMAYRYDLNAHENLFGTAQRKDAILRLAKFISYSPSRNIPARGLVKITSIQTTEQIYDSKGRNLAGKRILFNDAGNVDWKEQFLLVIGKVLQQPFGSVSPNERVQIDDVLFELYQLNNLPLTNGVIPYSVSFSGINVPFELAPASLGNYGPYERRPESNRSFGILYGSDGLGDQSDTTGFFFFTKQGSLQLVNSFFDGVTSNQTYSVNVSNINNTDVWLNQVDPNTLEIINDTTSATGGKRSGEWEPVDITLAQTVVFNTNVFRNKYEVETLDNDQIRLIFGDNEFANIPAGSFQIWVRSSAGLDTVVPQTAIVNKVATLTYLDVTNKVQTMSFTFSAINTFDNAAPSEDIEHIRRVAPGVYYTQDRMVNAEDYNNFPLQDPTILRLKTVNRTFSGDSKYVPWHDPSDTYENVKVFGDDLAIFVDFDRTDQQAYNIVNGDQLINNYLVPILSLLEMFILQTYYGVSKKAIRSEFNIQEYVFLQTEINSRILTQSADPIQVYLHYDSLLDQTSWNSIPPPTTENPSFDQQTLGPVLEIQRETSSGQYYFNIKYRTARLIVQSNAVRFWNNNLDEQPINYDTLNAYDDQIVLLAANTNASRTGILSANKNFTAYKQPIIGVNSINLGLSNTRRLLVAPDEDTNDFLPDAVDLSYLFDYTTTVTGTASIAVPIIVTIPFYAVGSITSITGQEIEVDDIIITGDVDSSLITYVLTNSTQPSETNVINTITITSLGTNTTATIYVKEYVYLVNSAIQKQFIIAEPTVENIKNYITQTSLAIPESQVMWIRERGRSGLNFAWFHTAKFGNLINPSASNIHDMFVITRGYYNQFKLWLQDKLSSPPTKPTPQQLKTDYQDLLDNAMLSDTIILHPGIIKPLFGSKADRSLQAKFMVIKHPNSISTDNDIKIQIVNSIRDYFDINNWDFNQTFYFTKLSAQIHDDLSNDVQTIVLVPIATNNQFGDLFQVLAREDEILQPHISVNDIQIVQSLDSKILKQEPIG